MGLQTSGRAYEHGADTTYYEREPLKVGNCVVTLSMGYSPI